MTDEARINEALAGHRDAEDRRRREVEELAERLFIGLMAAPGLEDLPLSQAVRASFENAEAWLAERDRRREQVKR